MEGLKKGILVRNGVCVGAVGDKYFSNAPIGVIQAFSGQTAPHGYLLCNGASYKVADYPDLYAVIGNTYGGDTENFNVPTVQPPALTMVYIIKAFHTNEGVDSGVSDDVVEYVNDSLVNKADKSYVDDNFATMDKVKDGYAKIIKNNDTDTNDAMFISYKNSDLFGIRIYKNDNSEHELKFSASGISYVKDGVTVWTK